MKITAICQECRDYFDYDLKPGFPRKYCVKCSAIKKAEYEASLGAAVEKPGQVVPVGTPVIEKTKTYPKDPVGLAVDIYVATIPYLKEEGCESTDAMKTAIKLVKQAQQAF